MASTHVAGVGPAFRIQLKNRVIPGTSQFPRPITFDCLRDGDSREIRWSKSIFGMCNYTGQCGGTVSSQHQRRRSVLDVIDHRDSYLFGLKQFSPECKPLQISIARSSRDTTVICQPQGFISLYSEGSFLVKSRFCTHEADPFLPV